MCETHDPTGEPDAVNPPVRFGERRLETEPWRGVRHRHCESRRQQLPPIRLPLPRQSPTLPFSATDPRLAAQGFEVRADEGLNVKGPRRLPGADCLSSRKWG